MPNENQPYDAYRLRPVLSVTKPVSGGWVAVLACGHTVWCAVNPGTEMYCGACLQAFVQTAKTAILEALAPPAGTPYGSRDVDHVAAPNPANYWDFRKGQHRVIAYTPSLTFEVTAIHETWIEGILYLEHQRIAGELHLNRPVVVVRNRVGSAPMVTFTLRKIEGGAAFIQVSASPEIEVKDRE